MSGEVQLSASRDRVWAMLNDPAVLKGCIPGCEQLELNDNNEFQAMATIKIGPVKARWKGKVRLSDLDPPNSYRISGEGEGGVAGFAKGGATVALSACATPAPSATSAPARTAAVRKRSRGASP